MKTVFETRENALKNRNWVLIDAKDQIVGRLASTIAATLRGKNNPKFTPHNDTGDFVVVINAEKIKFSGNKFEDKLYQHHTGFIGGVKTEAAKDLLNRKPEEILKKAVKGMLPKSTLGRDQFTKLKVYKGEAHPHEAQIGNKN